MTEISEKQDVLRNWLNTNLLKKDNETKMTQEKPLLSVFLVS